MTTDDRDAIVRAMDALRETLGEIRVALVGVQAGQEDLLRRVEGHSRTLYGNGQPGVVARLDRHEAVEAHSFTWRLLLVSGLIGFLGAGLAGLLVAWMT